MRGMLGDLLRRIPGSLGAAVVGLDGLPVEKVSAQEGFNIELVSAEGMGVVKRATLSLGDGALEPLEEITFTSRSNLTILRSLGSDYYLCVVVGSGCLPGRARYEVWRAGQQLRELIG